MGKDWQGNTKSVFSIIGASNHSDSEREKNDYYATDPIALEKLLEFETFNNNIWECACGEKHLSNVLIEKGFNVKSSDLINRDGNTQIIDFLKYDGHFDKYAKEFVLKALEVIPNDSKVAFLLKLTFLEGQARYLNLFKKNYLKTVYISTKRINCPKNGDFKKSNNNSAVAYAWFIFQKGYNESPTIKWFNY